MIRVEWAHPPRQKSADDQWCLVYESSLGMVAPPQRSHWGRVADWIIACARRLPRRAR